MATPPSKAVYILTGFFLLCGIGLLALGTYYWHDVHSGRAGTAHIYECRDHLSSTGVLNCEARWTAADGHVVSGYVENPKANQLGKDVAVRIHSNHVTETSNFVAIGLWVMGLFVTGVFLIVPLQIRRRSAQATDPTASA